MAESWQQNPHQWCFLPRPSELAALLAAKSISGVGIQFGVRRVGQSTEKWFRACYSEVQVHSPHQWRWF